MSQYQLYYTFKTTCLIFYSNYIIGNTMYRKSIILINCKKIIFSDISI